MLGSRQFASRHERREWWRVQIARQQSGNLSITEFCNRLGVTQSAFYYWRNRIGESPPNVQLPAPLRYAPRLGAATADTTTAEFVPVTIIDHAPNNQLEIELANGCALRLKGSVDPGLLQAAIAATGLLDSCHWGGR